MAYAVPASKASFKQNRFEFTVPGSRKKHSLPKFAYVPVGISQNAFADSTKPRTDELVALLVNLGVDQDAVFSLDGEQIFDIFGGWAQESGISLGESSASADD